MDKNCLPEGRHKKAKPSMIQIEHPVMNYGSNCAVPISLSMWEGEIVGFPGPNGKSTTIGL